MKRYVFFLLLSFMINTLYSIEYEVVKGDCLWNIAKQYYKNPFLWKKIYEMNKEKIKNPNLIYPGQKFILPDLQKEMDTLQEERIVEEKATVKEGELEAEIIFSKPPREDFVFQLLENFPKKIEFEEAKFNGKVLKGKENKFVYIDFDVIYIKPKNFLNLKSGDILGVYHKGPSKYDINLMNAPKNETNLVGIVEVKEINEYFITAEIIKTFSPIIVGDLIRCKEK